MAIIALTRRHIKALPQHVTPTLQTVLPSSAVAHAAGEFQPLVLQPLVFHPHLPRKPSWENGHGDNGFGRGMNLPWPATRPLGNHEGWIDRCHVQRRRRRLLAWPATRPPELRRQGVRGHAVADAATAAASPGEGHAPPGGGGFRGRGSGEGVVVAGV